MFSFRKIFPFLIMFTLLTGGFQAAAAPSSPETTIVIDGVMEAAWREPLASDPAGDMSEPNLDLEGLYVVEDVDNFYIGFDAKAASTYGMAYGIYLDTDANAQTGLAVAGIGAELEWRLGDRTGTFYYQGQPTTVDQSDIRFRGGPTITAPQRLSLS